MKQIGENSTVQNGTSSFIPWKPAANEIGVTVAHDSALLHRKLFFYKVTFSGVGVA